jgi:hypothetical protein
VDEDVATAHFLEEDQMGAQVEKLDEVERRMSASLSAVESKPAIKGRMKTSHFFD